MDPLDPMGSMDYRWTWGTPCGTVDGNQKSGKKNQLRLAVFFPIIYKGFQDHPRW